MAERRFFDTNVLVYVHDTHEPQKRKIARKIVSEHFGNQTAVVSTQVLQEYFVAATRLGLPPDIAQKHVATYAEASVVQVTVDLILAAIDLHRLHKLSFWDALVVRSARAGGCGVILTEDLRHGQSYDGVRVEDPFLR